VIPVLLGVVLSISAIVDGTQAPPPGGDTFARANEARRKHDYVAAARLYEEALRQDPGNGKVALALAETLLDMGQGAAAESLLVRLVASLPERPEPRRALAMAYLQNGKNSEALGEARQAVLLDPGNLEGHFCLGSALAAGGQLEQSVPELERSIQGSPPDVRALHRLAIVYAALDDPKASETFRRVLTLEPGNLGARLNWATYLWQIRDFEHGDTQMERVLRAAPSNTNLRKKYASSLVEQARYSQAAKQWEIVWKSGSRDYDTACSYAAALGASGRVDDAVRILRTAVQIDSQKLLAHHTLGRLLLVQQKPADAAAELELCARLQPGSAGIALELGRAYEAMEKLEKAEAAYREALRLDPALTKANYALGTLLARTGRREEAARYLAIYQEAFQKEQQAALAGGSRHAEVNLGWEELRHGRPEQALERFDRHPDNAEALRGAAQALIALHRDAEAVRRLESAVALAPEDAALRYELDRQYDRVRKQ
jgi:tetratricopeptide (TPR) repeat protein